MVSVKGLGSFAVAAGTVLGEFCATIQPDWPHPIVAADDMQYSAGSALCFGEGYEIELVDTTMEAGLRIYRRSASFLLIKACRDLFPQRILMIKHTLSNGLFCEFLDEDSTDNEIEAIQGTNAGTGARVICPFSGI